MTAGGSGTAMDDDQQPLLHRAGSGALTPGSIHCRRSRRPPVTRSIAIGRIAIMFTVVAWLTYVFAYFITGIINSSYQNNVDFLIETIVYVGITSFLALSALLYLVARQGALYRSRAAPPGAARRHRQLLRHHAAHDDGAGAVVSRGSVGGPQDPALRGAAGVPVPAGGAVARRPAEPDVGRAPGVPRGCQGAVRTS